MMIPEGLEQTGRGPLDFVRPLELPSKSRGRVLVVDHDELVRELLREVLEEHGYEVEESGDGAAALKVLSERSFEVVLLDLHLPRVSGLSVLSALSATSTDARFIVMTAFGSVETAVEAMKLGAYDYLRKPLDKAELLSVVERAGREVTLRRELTGLRHFAVVEWQERIVGKAPAMRRLFRSIEQVAATRASVLIEGESGTGKELVARALHSLSTRSAKRFVPINCSALPHSLLEAELFGHMKGSFTGALESRSGLIEEAHQGTLFLDEISTLDEDIQVKLLRVLQERTVQRVGARKASPIDFRLIAATNRNLEMLVRDGQFRDDLFYRLNVFPIRIPPLRERKEDIPLLAHYFGLRFSKQYGVDPPEIPPDVLRALKAYRWPGNVRELENFIERNVIMHPGGRVSLLNLGGSVSPGSSAELGGRAIEEKWPLARLEREYILAVLDRCGGRQTEAAEVLGINRRTIHRKLKQYREEGLLSDD